MVRELLDNLRERGDCRMTRRGRYRCWTSRPPYKQFHLSIWSSRAMSPTPVAL